MELTFVLCRVGVIPVVIESPGLVGSDPDDERIVEGEVGDELARTLGRGEAATARVEHSSVTQEP